MVILIYSGHQGPVKINSPNNVLSNYFFLCNTILSVYEIKRIQYLKKVKMSLLILLKMIKIN